MFEMGRGLCSLSLIVLVLEIAFRTTECGFCQESYSCPATCYRRSCTTTGCGFLYLGRCSRCSDKSYGCSKVCYRRVCCLGYTGTDCNDALCFGSSTCPNDGLCQAPDECLCKPGFAGSVCDDVDECGTGEAKCSHVCTNSQGSFNCSCHEGYTLGYDFVTCEDVNECFTDNGGCDHECRNTDGSFTCSCYEGYELTTNGMTCQDTDECSADSQLCDQICHNTVGSYTCACRDGFTLDLDGLTCNDNDECSLGESDCQQVCINEPGSYSCACVAGYAVSMQNISQCEDINECSANNGECSDDCANSEGSYLCHCPAGYTLDEDQRTCIEINECNDGTSLCDQICTKTSGPYTCSCHTGYRLMDDTFSCEDIDECANVTCYNGGTCINGDAHYTCRCKSGFTDQHCNTDINECAILNGGCEETCNNEAGSYHCSCEEPNKLHDNGLACSSKDQLLYSSDLVLPVGDFMVEFDGFQLSSTLKWYRSNSNTNIVYTHGIVHVETNILQLPVSIVGVQMDIADINTISNNVKMTKDEGTEMLRMREGLVATEHESNQTDVIKYISANSFARSYFEGIKPVLPNWATLSNDENSVLPIHELSTEISTGDQIRSIPSCRGAPVYPRRFYNIFVTTADVIIGLFRDKATISKSSFDSKICILVEITTGIGGSIFFMFTDRFPDELYTLVPFSSIHNADSVKFNDIDGFAFSIDKGISVKSVKKENEIEVWNGDHQFKYRLFSAADFWIKADVTIENDDVELDVTADLFLSMPNPLNLLTNTFEDKWDILFAVKESGGKISFIENIFELKFEIEDFILSVGGHDKRTLCGTNANPAGLYGTITWFDDPLIGGKRDEDTHTPIHYQTLDKHLDILMSLIKPIFHITYVSLKANLFITTSEYTDTMSITRDTYDSFLDDIEACSNNLIKVIKEVNGNGIEVTQLLKYADNLTSTITLFRSIYDNTDSPTMMISPALAFTNELKHHSQEIMNVSATVGSLGDIFDDNINCINEKAIALTKKVLSSTMSSSVALTNSLGNSDGFGFQVKNSLTLKICPEIELPFDLVVIEFVSSKRVLGNCGRFHRVYELFKDEDAFRFYIRVLKGIPLGKLLQIPVDLSGIGYAVSTTSSKFMLQALFEFSPFKKFYLKYTIKFNVNAFVTNRGLYAYAEVNFFSLFYVQLNVATEFSNSKLNQLIVHFEGRFVTSENRDINSDYTKRDATDKREGFSQSYLDSLVKLLEDIANNAKQRVEDVQMRITAAKRKIAAAQGWLESKKAAVTSAKSKFDDAKEFLKAMQKDVEKAKSVFETAIEKLEDARDKVTRLCTIKRCRRICIPGIRCKWFSCSWTSCMISFDDPLCVVKNVLCSIVRRAAFLFYDAAIAAVQVPLVALDAANVALWTAQIGVDLAKNSLSLAEVAVDLAQLGLEGVKIGLDLANAALNLIKLAVNIGLKILQFIIVDGIQNLLDVKNCGFDVNIDRPIQPTLSISCEINIFKTGWTDVHIRINFLNPLQSIWQAAKSTFNEIMRRINVFTRRKRELRHIYASHIHPLLRKIRQTNETESDYENLAYNDLNLPINVNSSSYNSSSNSDYDERVAIYFDKCNVVRQVYRFMVDIFHNLTVKCKDLKDQASELQANITLLASYSSEMFAETTLDDSGIDASVAVEEFNMTSDNVMQAFYDGLESLKTTSYLTTLLDMTSNTTSSLKEQKYSIEHLPVLTNWAAIFNESLSLYFEPNECGDIYDCIHVSIYRLNELFLDENVTENTQQIDIIDTIESTFLDLLNASDADIYTISNASTQITDSLNAFLDSIFFCDEAPIVRSKFVNVSAVIGRTVTYLCNATGDGELIYTWYRNDEVVALETNSTMTLHNITTDVHQVSYACTVENKIALTGSSDSFLTLHADCRPGSYEALGYCIPCSFGTYQNQSGQERCEECPDGLTTRLTGSTRTDQCVSVMVSKDGSNDTPILTVVLASTLSALGLCTIIVSAGVYIYVKRIKNPNKVFPKKESKPKKSS